MATISFRSNVKADSRLWADVSLTVTEQSYDVASNTSVVAYSFSGHQRNDGFTFTGKTRNPAGTVIVQINGGDVKSANIALINYGVGTCSGSGTVSVGHNADGTKTISFGIRMQEVNGNYAGDPWKYGYTAQSGSLTLTTIPRQSSISSVTGNNLGSGVTVNISRNSTAFTHKVWYSFNGSPSTTVSTNAGTSATFTPSLSLGSYIPNSTSGTLTVYVNTMNGSTKIGNTISKSIKLSLPSSVVPTMGTPTATRVDNGVPSSWGIYVKNKSKVTIKINSAAGVYGSTIKSYSITGNSLSSASSSATSGVLSASGTQTYTCKITDSRGRSVSKKVSISVVDYYNPSLKVSADRCNSSGVITGDGTYLRVVVDYSYASVSSKNSISSKSVTCNSVSNTTFGDNAAFTLAANCSIGSKYTLAASVTDALGVKASASIEIPTAARIINIRQNKKGIAFGKFSQKDAFEVALESYFEKPVHALNNLGVTGTFSVAGPSTINGNLSVTGTTSISNDLSATGSIARITGKQYAHTFDGNGDSSKLYMRFARITIKGSYINQPILMDIEQRSRITIAQLTILFANSGGTDPGLSNFQFIGSSSYQIYIVKAATSIWDLYIYKSEAWDNCGVYRCATRLNNDKITIQWMGEDVASVPSGATKANDFINSRIRTNEIKTLSGTNQGSTVTLYLTRCGNVVEGTVNWTGTSATNRMQHFTSLYVPAGWRPRFYVWFNAVHVVGSSIFDETKTTRYRIGPDGVFTCITNEGNNVERHATVSWIAYQ